MMDGRTYERDDFGDTHFGRANSGRHIPRFGQDPPAEDDASYDEIGPDTPPRGGQPGWQPRHGRPSMFGQPSSDQLPRRRHGYGADGPGTDSDGFEATPFRRRGGAAQERTLTPKVAAVDESDSESSGGLRLGGRRRGELMPASSHRPVRRGRVSDEDDDDGVARSRRTMPLWQELPLLLVVAFCLAVLIRTFLLQAFFIPSGSMEQTLLVGDRVLVNKIVYDVRPPERGEVVVFRGTDNWAPDHVDQPPSGLLGRIGRTMGDLVGVSRPGEKDFIKRVIALPGDRVSCCDPSGRVYVNGKGIDEPYVLNNSPLDVPPDPRVCRSRRFDEVLVPPGQIFVMGDHRIVSQDARCQGPVPIENVIGRAFVIVWPGTRWDTLNAPETFADVPGPVALGPPGSTGANVGVGAAVVTLPILASLVVTTRPGRKPRWGRRTLRK